MIKITLPIGEVAQRFGLRTSALRYYEEIELLRPAMRRAGRRYYGPLELKRLTLIQLLQDKGRLSLEQIADILTSQHSNTSSRRILNERIAILNDQIRTAQEAKDCLEHLLSCPRDDPFDGCPILAGELNRRLEQATAV